MPRFADEDLADARRILAELEKSYRERDVAVWGRLNWAFHRRLYAPADRSQTLAILQTINLQPDARYARLHLLMTDGIEAAEREHREILRLCAVRDAAGAVAFLREHILDAGRDLVAALRKQRAAGPGRP